MKIKTLIIAEAGVNHNGNLKTAYKLIDQAKYSGADFVKFQAYETDEICLETASLSRYQRDGKFKNQFDMLKKYELSKKQIILSISNVYQFIYGPPMSHLPRGFCEYFYQCVQSLMV